MFNALGAKRESAASESSLKAPLEQEVLQRPNSRTQFVSSVASPRAKVKSRKNDAWHVPDVVGTKWGFLAAEVSELQALLKKEVLQRQFSPGDALDFSADLKIRESLSRESLALFSKPEDLMVSQPLIASTTASKSSDGTMSPDDVSASTEVAPFAKMKALIMDHPLLASTTASKSSDGTTSPDDVSTSTEVAPFTKTKALIMDHPLLASTTASKSSNGSTSPDDGSSTPEVTSFPKPKSLIVGRPLIVSTKASKASDCSTSPDVQSTSPDDQSPRSLPFYSTRTTGSTSLTESCKFFVERIKDM
jgi:hypothetical protein